MTRISWLSACSALAIAAATSAAAEPTAPQNRDHAQAVATVRAALLQAQGVAAEVVGAPTSTSPSQWGNWNNWGKTGGSRLFDDGAS